MRLNNSILEKSVSTGNSFQSFYDTVAGEILADTSQSNETYCRHETLTHTNYKLQITKQIPTTDYKQTRKSEQHVNYFLNLQHFLSIKSFMLSRYSFDFKVSLIN